MTPRAAVAYQEFLVGTKTWWMTRHYPALRREYERRAARGPRPRSAAEVERLLADSDLAASYAWLERHVQRFKYTGRWGLLPLHEAERAAIEARLDAAARDSGLLHLDPSVPVPDYYAGVDTHQHPGNLHGDTLAGAIYKASAASTQPGATAAYALHERIADFVAARGAFRRILDLGCGFGKSTLPLAWKFRDAAVEGVDLSAPCLKLAAAEAMETQTRNVAYRQMDLTRTGYEPGRFDLVTSTMVLHELDPPAVEAALAETWRLLAPGGTAIHIDFRVADPFLTYIHYGHSRRNNEPFMVPLNEMDLEERQRRLGFERIETVPFAETDAAAAPDFPYWRFPWTAFIARKPA